MTPAIFQISPTLVWFVLGLALCLVEFFLPTAFVAFMMGVSALIVALLSPVVPAASVQVLLWALFSLGLVYLAKRYMPKRNARSLEDASEAETLTEIPPGKTGRVRLEGNSWQAACSDETVAIDPHQKVYVVGRRGNTLIVLPEKFLQS